MLVKHYLRADWIQCVGQRKNVLLKWGYNNALVREAWAQWAFCLLKSRYGDKDLPKASTFLGSGHLKTERKHKEYFLVGFYLPIEVTICHNSSFKLTSAFLTLIKHSKCLLSVPSLLKTRVTNTMSRRCLLHLHQVPFLASLPWLFRCSFFPCWWAGWLSKKFVDFDCMSSCCFSAPRRPKSGPGVCILAIPSLLQILRMASVMPVSCVPWIFV